METLKALWTKIYTSEAVRKAALVLAGAIGTIVAQHFGFIA